MFPSTMDAVKERISTLNAPEAIGPYSQAVMAGAMVFVSGQIPLDPTTGHIVPGDAGAQATQVLKNLAAILSAAGCDFSDVVRTTIFLVDMAHFAMVNEVYARFFTEPYPARATVQVTALPRGAHVEIDAIALTPFRSK